MDFVRVTYSALSHVVWDADVLWDWCCNRFPGEASMLQNEIGTQQCLQRCAEVMQFNTLGCVEL